MENMKNILVLLIVLLAIASVESFGWGYSYYGGQQDFGIGDYPTFNAGGSFAGAILGKKK
uniref:ALT-3 protein n=2 Tax=Onchocerca TaxID=6281 RepID=O16855_ONCVO|nr:ALT-3 protein [Onchocerca volvulus]